MLKHIARHNQQRAVIVYREIPGEEHMSLIVYSDTLPRAVHDELMKTVESLAAQSTPDLFNVLFRTLGVDGINLLQTLHINHWLKKVPCNQVIVTPTPTSNVRLDELNKILKEMAPGEEAVKKLAEIDSQRGMTTKPNTKKPVEKEVGVPPNSRAGEVDVSAYTNSGVLSDADLAKQRRDQAAQMKLQAEQLLAEAKRLESEAKDLTPTSDVKRTKTKKATTAKKQEA